MATNNEEYETTKIYKIVNGYNQVVYCGKTVRALETRFNEHKKKLDDKCAYITDPVNKCEIVLIKEVETDVAHIHEEMAIDHYKTNIEDSTKLHPRFNKIAAIESDKKTKGKKAYSNALRIIKNLKEE